MLTPAEVERFRAFGFLLLRARYAAGEIARLRRLLEDALAEDREGKPDDPRRRHALLGFMEHRDESTAWLEDDRLYAPLAQLLGDDFVFTGSDGNRYSGDTPWHPDSDADLLATGFRRIKVALYLDPLTARTGALRVIPGSHRSPLFDDLDAARRRPEWATAPFGVAPRELPAVALESTPGDVVLFDSHCWHASFGGGDGRMMVALSYAQRPTRPEHDDTLRGYHAMNLRHIRDQGFRQRDWMYGEAFLASARQRVRRMTRRLVELGLR